MNRVGVILVCTRKYDVFLQPLIDSMEKYFFTGEPYDIYLLTDKPQTHLEALRATIYVREIPAYRFPFATLYRYKNMVIHRDVFTAQNLYYLDVDMKFVAEVGDEILGGGLVAIQHPGYYLGGWGSKRTHPHSLFYVPPNFWNGYYCGGFQGGTKESYLIMAEVLNAMIDIDMDTASDMGYLKNDGILAEYHDESAYNWYLKFREKPSKVLSPSYCYPESWDIPFEKKLLALDKNHKEIRL